MLEENEVSGKDQFLGDPVWLSEMYTIQQVRYLRTITTVPFQSPLFSSSMCRKKLADKFSISFPEPAMFDNHTTLLFWLQNKQYFHILSLRDLRLMHAQKIMGCFTVITHKSMRSENWIIWMFHIVHSGFYFVG